MTQRHFTHLTDAGEVHMVDVTHKTSTTRTASARATVSCPPAVIEALRDRTVPKGDVLALARIAGIAAAKRTPELLPLAHVIGVHGARVDVTVTDSGVDIVAAVSTHDVTGVEMEALTAASVAALAIIDMVKGLDKSVSISEVSLLSKSGGKSGDWHAT